jgi:multidrug efflux pump
MWLSDLSVKRPVLSIVMSALLILFGLMGLSRLTVREYPDIDPPIVSISTVYPGANPAVIETTITEPLEEELTSIEGIRTLVSKSQEQISVITIEFELSRDVNIAAQDVRDRVARARDRLPKDIEEPIITKQDADAQAIMWLGLYGENYSQLQISDYADRYIKDQLQTVSGVGRVIIGGRREYSMRIWVEPEKLAARNVTVLDVQSALQKENIELPSGRIEGKYREFTVKTLGQMKSPDEFKKLIVKRVNGVPVRLQDLGSVEVGPKSDRSLVRFNGIPAVGLGIVKQSKANTIDVAHAVKERVKLIQQRLPKGLKMQPAFDASTFIEQSVDEVKESLIIACGLVVLVIFIFLRNVRATLIPTLAIPVSIVATFALMAVMGFSINILTLLGLTLAVGLVVDDAIVVLENIYRYIEEGDSPKEAALKGTREIGFAVIATTFVLVAVFVPVAFMTGATGRLFSEFALVVASSVLISGFVSLTLAPTLSSKLLKRNIHAQQASRIPIIQPFLDGFEAIFERIRLGYDKALDWAMQFKKTVVASVLIVLLLSGGCYMLLQKEFLPTEDRSNIFTIISSAEGSTLDYTDLAVRQAEAIYAKLPEVARYFSVIALSAEGVGQVNSGFMFVSLKPKEERARKQQDIVTSIFPQMMMIPQAFVFPISPPSGPSRGFGKPIQLVLKSFNMKDLSDTHDRIIKRAKAIPGVFNVDSDLKLNKPELEIQVNREKAAEQGVSVRDISNTLQIMLGGLDLSNFQLNNKRYDVMVQMPKSDRMTPQQMDKIYVENGMNQLVPITNLIDYEESVSAQAYNHYGRLRSATIDASVLPFITMGQAIDELEKIVKEEAGGGVTYEWTGESREYIQAQSAANIAFLIALIVVFLVLSAQFESFVHPLVILLTVPLAVSGALISLYLFGATVSIYSQIGMILLVGLVTKNGILIVEYANQLFEKHRNYTVTQAVVEAAKIRFRPILMTTIATIFGAVPIAMGIGAGAESRQPLGIAIIGGMILSTALTLFIIPIAYVWINQKRMTHEPTFKTLEAV